MFVNNYTYANGQGFYQIETDKNFIDYIPGELNKLVITFENAENPNEPRPDKFRYPWGGVYLNRKGFSVLGVKPKHVDWYRSKCLHEFFRSEEFKAFSQSFVKVYFYGSSMGGFGALVFSDTVPNSIVIAFNPQSSLDENIAGWDKRYPQGTSQFWGGDFSDAAIFPTAAKKIFLAYDPFCREDGLHARRIESDRDNVISLKMPFVGHVMMSWLQKSGVLTQFIEGAFAESLTDFDCWLLARSRRKIARYYHMLGTLNKNPSTVKLCIYSILIIDEVPENFARIIFELTKLVGKSDDIDITTIPLKSRDDMAKNSVGKGYFYLAKRLSDLGDVEKSLKFSLKIIRYGGYHASILINVAECYIKLNTYELANFYANEAFNVCEKEELANVYRIKSRILLKLDKPLLALEMAKESVEIDYNMMGLKDCFNALLKTENFDEALSYAIIISDQFGDDTYLKKLKVKE